MDFEKFTESYSGGCRYGQLQVDKVSGIGGSGTSQDAPWIRSLKAVTDQWKNRKVYYSQNTAFFNSVKKASSYDPHLFVWAEWIPVKDSSGKKTGVQLAYVKLKVFSPVELAKVMEIREQEAAARKEAEDSADMEQEGKSVPAYQVKPETFAPDSVETLREFVQKYDFRDPAASEALRNAVLDLMKKALDNAEKSAETEEQ